MLDINYIKDNVDVVKQGMINKGEKDHDIVDQVVVKDEEWRSFVHKLDTLRSDNNAKATDRIFNGTREKRRANS